MNKQEVDGAQLNWQQEANRLLVSLSGNWKQAQQLPDFEPLQVLVERPVQPTPVEQVLLQCDSAFEWDSRALAKIHALRNTCIDHNIELITTELPEAIHSLLALSGKVAPLKSTDKKSEPWLDRLTNKLLLIGGSLKGTAEFTGQLTFALLKLPTGRSQTRFRDFLYFFDLGGPKALGIVGLISVLVGMILAYLGSVQLRQFGAEVYVANLVALSMVREMGPLMTAVIMAGRTGAAYAAQLGTMQANEEIDAINTLGLSVMEYLVVPRLLALILVMPLLVIFSNLIGLAGGALVAAGMDVNFTQFLNQARAAVTLGDVATGLIKSLAFAAVIAIAGCRAGVRSGRDSAAVGQATTAAVVHAIVYLVVVDAALNILYNQLGV